MTKYTIAILAALSAGTAIADDVYHGLAEGNTDLFDGHRGAERVVGMQPGIGDRLDIYGGLAEGNRDLFSRIDGPSNSGSRPDIYQGFGDNPDLR